MKSMTMNTLFNDSIIYSGKETNSVAVVCSEDVGNPTYRTLISDFFQVGKSGQFWAHQCSKYLKSEVHG